MPSIQNPKATKNFYLWLNLQDVFEENVKDTGQCFREFPFKMSSVYEFNTSLKNSILIFSKTVLF